MHELFLMRYSHHGASLDGPILLTISYINYYFEFFLKYIFPNIQNNGKTL